MSDRQHTSLPNAVHELASQPPTSLQDCAAKLSSLNSETKELIFELIYKVQPEIMDAYAGQLLKNVGASDYLIEALKGFDTSASSKV